MINWKNVEDEIANGYIKVNVHPTEPLFIYNYSQKTQFERRWNDETMQCRGLITDVYRNIVSRPLPKFFNYGEVPTPTGSFTVHEKVDGVLGISYFVGGKPYIATRGRFDSEGAIVANSLLKEYDCQLDPSLTYMFEIIHPVTQIVVDYPVDELVFLAAVETATGSEVDVDLPMRKPQVFDLSLEEVLTYERSNFEGFILKFEGGERLKVKLEEYLSLHRIRSGMSEKAIWERLLFGLDIDSYVARMPDAIQVWVKEVEGRLRTNYDRIYSRATADLIACGDGSRRELAARIKQYPYWSIMFLLLDKKDPAYQIWQIVKREQSTIQP